MRHLVHSDGHACSMKEFSDAEKNQGAADDKSKTIKALHPAKTQPGFWFDLV